MTLNMPNPPGLSIGPSDIGWTITAYLQVGSRSYRHYDKCFTQLEDALEFIKAWVANWKALAEDTWDYYGLEDITELDVDKKISPEIQLALANLIPPKPIYRRRLG